MTVVRPGSASNNQRLRYAAGRSKPGDFACAAKLYVIAILCMVFVLAPQLVPATVVGVVTVSDGESHLIRGNGYFEIERGIDIDEGDVIQTKDGANVQVEMRDGSILEVGPASEFYINEYQLRDDDSVKAATVSLVKGWLRFVTARLRPSSHYEMNMSVATIGIRGTEGVLSTDGETSSLLLNHGEVEFAEVNEAGELGLTGPVKAGEFIRRDRGKRFSKHRAAPERFLVGMPGRFKKPPQRFKSRLQRRGVKPKMIRAVRHEDVARLFGSNPRVRKKLKDRFGSGARGVGHDRGGKSSGKQSKPPKSKGRGKHKQQRSKGSRSKK